MAMPGCTTSQTRMAAATMWSDRFSIRSYHDAWAVAGDGPGHTWTADNPNAATVIDQIVGQPGHRRRIDYVVVGSWDAAPGAGCRIEAAALAFDQPTDGVWLSDHFGVVVDLDLADA
jgi:hypothetical protein